MDPLAQILRIALRCIIQSAAVASTLVRIIDALQILLEELQRLFGDGPATA